MGQIEVLGYINSNKDSEADQNRTAYVAKTRLPVIKKGHRSFLIVSSFIRIYIFQDFLK